MRFLDAFVSVFLDMSLYMLIGMVLTGVLHVVMKRDTVARHLGPKAKLPAVKAAALGVPLPLCSCGVLPTTVYLSQSGASTSATMAFLISTPQTGVDSIIATFGMMGLVFAIYRPVAAFISGVAGGALVQKIAGNKRMDGAKPEAECAGDCAGTGQHCATDCVAEPKEKSGVKERLKSMVKYAFVEFIDDIALHFVVGVIIAALITMLIPGGFFESIHISSGIVAMLVMLVIGMPMYICSTSSIPIALALMAKGISPGAAFVFLFAGPATNAASLSVLTKSLGKKTVAIYLGVTAVSAVGFGLLLDGLINWLGLPMPAFTDMHAMHETSWLNIATGVIFGGVLLRSLIARLVRFIKARRQRKQDAAMVLNVEGMTCEHCAKAVREAAQAQEGVQSVHVDLKQGKAYIEGDGVDLSAVAQRIQQAGYQAHQNTGIVLAVEGMTCEHCAKAVREAAMSQAGVQSARVDLKQGKLHIEGEGVDLAALVKKIEQAGYSVSSE